MNTQERLNKVQERIKLAEICYQREPGSVQLLAVSKRQPVTKLREVVACGQSALGENQVQEALDKQAQLNDLKLQWHFIGNIQSNKTKLIAQHFDWVHSVASEKIARRLHEQRQALGLTPMNVCIELNVDNEVNKSGINIDDLSGLKQLADYINSLDGLSLRGLMAIPSRSDDVAKQRSAFAKVRMAKQAVEQDGIGLDTLSMGMTQDLDAAIAEGATIVRVGTGVFGPRLYA